jgi:hypothetical protein
MKIIARYTGLDWIALPFTSDGPMHPVHGADGKYDLAVPCR